MKAFEEYGGGFNVYLASALSSDTNQGETAAKSLPRRAGAPTRDGLLVRTVDVLVALIALLVFSPIMLFSAATIALTSSGPILFRQQRIGRDGELFTCLKFRTMHVNASEMLDALLADCPAARAEWAENHKLRNDPRIIGIGNFLRRTSLDELPQIFNVLAGEMAIVGPRPIVTGEIARYGRYIGDYCSVRPGITGLWQVSGRSETSYRCRVACDRLYARRKSILGDIRIMACTVPVVLLGQGAC